MSGSSFRRITTNTAVVNRPSSSSSSSTSCDSESDSESCYSSSWSVSCSTCSSETWTSDSDSRAVRRKRKSRTVKRSNHKSKYRSRSRSSHKRARALPRSTSAAVKSTSAPASAPKSDVVTPCNKRRRSRSDSDSESTSKHLSKSKKSKSSSKYSLDKQSSKENFISSKSKKVLREGLKRKNGERCCWTPSPCERNASPTSSKKKKKEQKEKDEKEQRSAQLEKRRHELPRERSPSIDTWDGRRSGSNGWRSPCPREQRSPCEHRSRSRVRRSHSSQLTLPITYWRRSESRTPSPLNMHGRDLNMVRLHIKGLTRQVTKTHILEIFGSYGPLTNVDFPLDHVYRNGCPPAGRGFAFVEYAHPEDCRRALTNMDGGRIDGRRIVVSPFERKLLRLPYRRRNLSSSTDRHRS